MANNITSLQYSSVVVSAVLAAAGEPPRDPDSEAGKAYSELLEACQEFQEVELAQARAERWKERYLAGKAAAKARGSSLGGTPSLDTA